MYSRSSGLTTVKTTSAPSRAARSRMARAISFVRTRVCRRIMRARLRELQQRGAHDLLGGLAGRVAEDVDETAGHGRHPTQSRRDWRPFRRRASVPLAARERHRGSYANTRCVQDPYDVLGVERGASPDEVKSAFRRLAQRFHPDKNPGDDRAQQKFKEINAAYQILSDPEKRAMFDRFGSSSLGGAGGVGVPGGFDFGDLGNINMDGIFGDLLRGFGIRTGERGDLKKEIVVTFEEAAFGAEKELTYERTEMCKDCRGSGSEEGHLRETCSRLHGPRAGFAFSRGFSRWPSIAPARDATVPARSSPIPARRAAARASWRWRGPSTSPFLPGIEHGATRTVERGGNLLRPDRAPGDLELTIAVAPHPFFKRSSDDVTCSVPISFVQAALGGELRGPDARRQGQAQGPRRDPVRHRAAHQGQGHRAPRRAAVAAISWSR